MLFTSIATLFASLTLVSSTRVNSNSPLVTSNYDISEYFSYQDYDNNDNNSIARIYSIEYLEFYLGNYSQEFSIYYDDNGTLIRLFGLECLQIDSHVYEITYVGYGGPSYYTLSLKMYDDNHTLFDTYTNYDLLAYDNTDSIVLTNHETQDSYINTEVYFDFVPLAVARYLNNNETESANAFQEGYNTGYESGYNNGFTAGTSSGYQEGYNAGYEAWGVEGDFTEIFANILQVGILPVNVFLAMMNFDILGINVGGFVSGLLTIAMIVIITRTIIGGGNKND